MPALYIPEPNPIRFYDKIDSLDGYSQKYRPGDATNLQFTSSNVQLSITVNLYDNKNRLIKTMIPRTDTLNTTAFYTLLVDFAGLQGLYRLHITATGTGILERYYSGCIHVCEKHSKLHVLQYKNTKNKDGVNYTIINSFKLRVEGGFLGKNYTPRSEDTVYQNQPTKFMMLHSDTYLSRRYHAGRVRGIPDDLHYIIHKAWGNNSVYVDDKGFAKYSGAEWEPSEEDNYNFRTWVLDVVPTGKTFISDVDNTAAGKWGDYICRIENSEFTGEAIAETLTITKTNIFGVVVTGYPKVYSILPAFTYSGVVYPALTSDDLASMMYDTAMARCSAFLAYVINIEGAFAMDTGVNLINSGFNLINNGFNIVNKIGVEGLFIIDSDYCKNTGYTYIGVTGNPNPTAAEIQALTALNSNNANIDWSYDTNMQYALVCEPAEYDPFIRIMNEEDNLIASFRQQILEVDGKQYRLYIYYYPTIDTGYHISFQK